MNKRSLIVLAAVIMIAATFISMKMQSNADSGAESGAESAAEAQSQPAEQAVKDITAHDHSEHADKVDAADAAAFALKDKVDHPALNNAPLDTDYVMGDLNAPITLVEYASLSCPHCADFHEKVLPIIKRRYIKNGEVKYILRQFPLNAPALLGAKLVDCIGENHGDDRYYTFNKALFAAQKRWAFDADYRKSLRNFAEAGGIASDEFKTCVNDKERETKLLEIRKLAGEALGVSGTPYIILNGHPHGGNRSYNAVKKEIDALLAAQKATAAQ